MTPQHARFAFGAFFLVASGIASNAVFMQASPAVTAAERAAAEKAALAAAFERAVTQPIAREPEAAAAAQPASSVRFARFKPDAARTDALLEVPGADAGSETVRAIQRELGQRGYRPVMNDGVPGPVTRAAIMAYERDQGLPMTGEASEALLRRLILGASVGAKPDRAQAGQAQSPEAQEVVRSVQASLAQLGYRPGRVNGRLGEETERAIREFELDEGQVPTGAVNGELVARLAKVTQRRTASAR